MTRRLTDKQVHNQKLLKQSEMKKPYMNDSYEEMEHFFPTIWGGSDYPMPRYNFNPTSMPDNQGISPKDGNTVSWVGCEIEFPGLFSEVAQGETKCVSVVPKTHFYYKNGQKVVVQDDPIVSWSVTANAVITSQSISGACIKVNTDAVEGDIVQLTATTKSGLTCDSMGWVIGGTCEGMYIGYSTNVMSVGQDQGLTAIGSGGRTVTWSLTGGGSLSTATGYSTTYTAPDHNAECTDNATITLTCDGDDVDSLNIAINEYATNVVAYDDKNIVEVLTECCAYSGGCSNPPPCGGTYCGHKTYYYCRRYNCEDEILYECPGPPYSFICDYGAAAVTDRAICNTYPGSCGTGLPWGVTDKRTAAMITAGCCPAGLI